jgi:hypothetical protein
MGDAPREKSPHRKEVMAKDVQPPDADQVNALLREADSKEFHHILGIFSTREGRAKKLIKLEQILNDSARRRGTGRLSGSSHGLSEAKLKKYFPPIESLVYAEHTRRVARADAKREELSRQITPEELTKMSDSELALMEIILNERVSNRQKQLEVLRLICYSKSHSELRSPVWGKWDSIAATASDQAVDDVSQGIHKEWTSRNLDVSKVLNPDA